MTFLLLLACTKDPPPDDTSSPDTADTAVPDTGVPDTADTGSPDTGSVDTGDTGWGPCGESGLCWLPVEEPVAECGKGGPSVLTATPVGGGRLDVLHTAVKEGCCPTLEAEAELDLYTGQITANLNFLDDVCDCICMLDVSYTLTEVPAGEWTLWSEGTTIPVSVE